MIALAADGKLSLAKVLRRIHDAWRYDLLVEAGPTLARSFMHEGLADRIWLIRSPTRVNESTAPAGAGIPTSYIKTGELDLAGDHLTEYLNPSSVVFFAPQASADLVLANVESP